MPSRQKANTGESRKYSRGNTGCTQNCTSTTPRARTASWPCMLNIFSGGARGLHTRPKDTSRPQVCTWAGHRRGASGPITAAQRSGHPLVYVEVSSSDDQLGCPDTWKAHDSPRNTTHSTLHQAGTFKIMGAVASTRRPRRMRARSRAYRDIVERATKASWPHTYISNCACVSRVPAQVNRRATMRPTRLPLTTRTRRRWPNSMLTIARYRV